MSEKRKLPIEIIHKEIDLIQTCILRMANNSFILKGWYVSLTSVTIALLLQKGKILTACLIVMVITLCFWYMDAFFLRKERMYRKLYEWVLVERLKDNDEKLYDLNSERFSKEVDGIIGVMFSQILKCFYGIPMLIAAFLFIYSLLNG